MRSLQKLVEKIARKLALRVVREEKGDEDVSVSTSRGFVVDESHLAELVGQPKFAAERLYAEDGATPPPGVVMGLAWTSMGLRSGACKTQLGRN